MVNPCRVFGLDDESGTVIASWPDPERKPAVPVPYAQETMHGMEYAFGEMLMLTSLPESGSRPGHYFHTAESTSGREQKVVLIRLAQVPQSDTFAETASPLPGL